MAARKRKGVCVCGGVHMLWKASPPPHRLQNLKKTRAWTGRICIIYQHDLLVLRDAIIRRGAKEGESVISMGRKKEWRQRALKQVLGL